MGKELFGPVAVQESAEKYLAEPEALSNDTRAVLGYLYRDYLVLVGKGKPQCTMTFPQYALRQWFQSTLPVDATV